MTTHAEVIGEAVGDLISDGVSRIADKKQRMEMAFAGFSAALACAFEAYRDCLDIKEPVAEWSEGDFYGRAHLLIAHAAGRKARTR